MIDQKTIEWIEKLPESVSHVRVRIGDTSLTTVGCIGIEGRGYKDDDSDFSATWCDIDALSQVIGDMLSDGDFGHLHRKARLHAHSKNGKQVRTKSLTAERTERASQISSEAASIQMLTQGLLSMAAEMRRSLHVLSDSLSWSEHQRRESEEHALSARVDALDAESYSRALEMLTDEPHDEYDPLKEQAANVLGQVAGMFTGQQHQAPTKDQIKEWVANKEWFESVMHEPEIQEAILNAYVQQTTKEEPNTEQKNE